MFLFCLQNSNNFKYAFFLLSVKYFVIFFAANTAHNVHPSLLRLITVVVVDVGEFGCPPLLYIYQ